MTEKKKREASAAATSLAHALVDHLNTGYVSQLVTEIGTGTWNKA